MTSKPDPDADLVTLIEQGLATRDQDDVRVYTCSSCKEPGHSLRTCPKLGRTKVPRHR